MQKANALLTTAEVAERLRVSTSFLAKARVTGLGPTSLDAVGDSYTIPVGVGVLVGLNRTFDIGARFDMPRLIAGTASGADARSLTAWVSVRPL